jgi:hypothetical protein
MGAPKILRLATIIYKIDIGTLGGCEIITGFPSKQLFCFEKKRGGRSSIVLLKNRKQDLKFIPIISGLELGTSTHFIR